MKKINNYSIALMLLVILNSCGSTTKVFEDVMVETTQSAREISRMIKNDYEIELFPVVSPDGKKVLFATKSVAKNNTEKVWTIKMMEMGKPGVVTVNDNNAERPCWYPNGNGYLFTYTKGRSPLLAKSNITNTGITFISSNAFGDDDRGASLILGGKKVLFQTIMGGNYQICTCDSIGLNFTILTDGEYPSWNEKENKILFTKKVNKDYQIFTYNYTTGQVTQLTSGDVQNTAARWSADYKYIVFASDRDKNKSHIYYMKADGTNITQLTTGDYQESTPFWSADNYIYFVSNAGFRSTKDNLFANTDLWRLTPILNN
jgi:TolB protein